MGEKKGIGKIIWFLVDHRAETPLFGNRIREAIALVKKAPAKRREKVKTGEPSLG